MSIGSGEMTNSPKSSEMVICDFPTGSNLCLAMAHKFLTYIAEIIH